MGLRPTHPWPGFGFLMTMELSVTTIECRCTFIMGLIEPTLPLEPLEFVILDTDDNC